MAESVDEPSLKRPRRTPEERAALARAKAERAASRKARTAEKARRRAEREARARRIAERAQAVARSLERRAARAPNQPARQATSSTRKAVRKMLHAAGEADAKAEREAARIAEAGGDPIDRGTGLTRLKLSTPPIGRLIEAHKIGAEERNAADEIATAFNAIAASVSVRGASLERIDRSGSPDRNWSAEISRAVRRYTPWAAHWTNRANAYGDPLLGIVVAAVVDEHPIRLIGSDLGYHHTRVENAVIFGLRDYAARAGDVPRSIADAWIAAAESLFAPANTRLRDAIRRARIER